MLDGLLSLPKSLGIAVAVQDSSTEEVKTPPQWRSCRPVSCSCFSNHNLPVWKVSSLYPLFPRQCASVLFSALGSFFQSSSRHQQPPSPSQPCTMTADWPSPPLQLFSLWLLVLGYLWALRTAVPLTTASCPQDRPTENKSSKPRLKVWELSAVWHGQGINRNTRHLHAMPALQQQTLFLCLQTMHGALHRDAGKAAAPGQLLLQQGSLICRVSREKAVLAHTRVNSTRRWAKQFCNFSRTWISEDVLWHCLTLLAPVQISVLAVTEYGTPMDI